MLSHRLIKLCGTLVLIFVAALAAGCRAEQPFKQQSAEDALLFKQAYEALNDESDELGNALFTKLEIAADNNAVVLSFEEAIELLTRGSGVLYLGRPGCPWCRLLLPSLLHLAKDEDFLLYYYDAEEIRAENGQEYQQLLALLDEYLPQDSVTQQPGDADYNPELKRLVLPHLFFVQRGEIAADLPGYQHPLLAGGENELMYQLLQEKYLLMQQK